MATPTAQEIVDQIDTTILSIVKGQDKEVWWNNKKWTKLDLVELRATRKQYAAMIPGRTRRVRVVSFR